MALGDRVELSMVGDRDSVGLREGKGDGAGVFLFLLPLFLLSFLSLFLRSSSSSSFLAKVEAARSRVRGARYLMVQIFDGGWDS